MVFCEGRTIDTSFYQDITVETLAKFNRIGFECLLNLNEEIYPRSFNLAYFVIRGMDYFRDCVDKVLPYDMILSRVFKNLKETMEYHPFDERYILFSREMSSLKAKQPRRPPPKKPSNVVKSYHKALPAHENMSNEQRETRGMFKNMARALHNMGRMLKEGCP
ncbi:hypothetical protein Tco_0783621 [Tanacetum coccineum]